MPTISPVSSSTTTSPATSATTAARLSKKTLGKDDFLKLLATQFQKQDPMKPMDDTAFIAQMAQFSSLEQASAMAQDMAALRADQQRVTASSYLGHRVTVDAGEGETITDDVTAIDLSRSTPEVIVRGKPYAISAVLRIEPSVLTTPTPAPQPVNSGGI
jgi:flagellar basal-body rod modification protein FlgD